MRMFRFLWLVLRRRDIKAGDLTPQKMIKAPKSTDARLLQRLLEQAALLQIPHRGKHAPATRARTTAVARPMPADVPVISTDRMHCSNSVRWGVV